MKILQVNCVYRNGSTGKLVADLHSELQQQGHRSVVAYGRGSKEKDAHVHRTGNELLGKLNHAYSRVTGVLYGGCFLETQRLIRLIRKEKPDVVHLHCINGFFVNIYTLLRWLGKNGQKTVLTLHAEFMYTGSCGYALDCDAWKTEGCRSCPQWRSETGSLFGDRTARAWRRMQAAFAHIQTKNLRVVAVSPWLEQRSLQSVILRRYPHAVVYNGIDTEVFHPCITSQQDAAPKEGRPYMIFHATAFFSEDPSQLKGGYYLLKLAEQMKELPVRFYVAGPHDPALQVPQNVTLLGKITDQSKLAAYYSHADVTLLTSKRETFSMICAESLCCGTPIVGFYAGAPETISIPTYSTFTEFGNVDALQAALMDVLAKQHPKEEIAASARALYSKRRMAAEYSKIYEELCAEESV